MSDADLLALARPAIRALKAYSSARSLAAQADVFLDANESPWAPEGARPGINRYPEPQPRALRRRLAEIYGVNETNLFVGRGADEAIDVLVRSFCEAGREAVLICPPTYGVYEIAAATQGADVVRVPLGPGFGLDPQAVLGAWRPSVKIVFICTPNNPTGNSANGLEVLALARELSGRALVVADEAYGEFSDQPSLAAALPTHPNLVVLRTLSKAWALAGARCGSALAHPTVIETLQKVRAPYPLSLPAIDAVLREISPAGEAAMRARVALVRAERDRLAAGLRQLPQVERVYPSDANFVLARARDARAFMQAARARGIVARDRSQEPGLAGCVRVTVGAPAETDRLLEALS